MLFKIRKAIRSDKFEKCLFIFGLLFMFYGIIRIFINPPIQELIIFIISSFLPKFKPNDMLFWVWLINKNDFVLFPLLIMYVLFAFSL